MTEVWRIYAWGREALSLGSRDSQEDMAGDRRRSAAKTAKRMMIREVEEMQVGQSAERGVLGVVGMVSAATSRRNGFESVEPNAQMPRKNTSVNRCSY